MSHIYPVRQGLAKLVRYEKDVDTQIVTAYPTINIPLTGTGVKQQSCLMSSTTVSLSSICCNILTAIRWSCRVGMQKILQSASTNGKRAPPLRDYQAKTLQLMKDYDGQAALCNIATGLGKTRIYTEYIRWDVSENDHHVLILSHREELVRQPLEYLKDLPCGIELGPLHADGEPIISASVQSLVGRLSEYNPYSIDTIIIDEAHHSAAPTYRKIFEYFKNAVRFGFTATSVRGDGVGLAVVFKEILCEFNTLYGIEHGYLSPIDACQVNLKFDLGTVQYREAGS